MVVNIELVEDSLKMNEACQEILQICIDADDDKTTYKTAVKDIQKILVYLAFSLDFVDDK